MSKNSEENLANQEELVKVFEARMLADPMLWGKLFFDKHLRMRSPWFHYELIKAVLSYQKFVVAAPRGSAKSTLLSFLFPFHGIVFKKFRFIVNISNTFKKSAMNLDAIKKELADNQLFKETFPPITITRDAEGDSEFRHQDGFETKFLCKGVDQLGSLRGVKFRAYRPDLVIIDDLEDDEMVKNIERRVELKDEFDEVLNQIGDKDTQFIVVGTMLHDDCQLAKLLSKSQYPEFKKCILRAHINPDTEKEESLWTEKWDLDYLKKLRKEKPNVYAKEMQNDPVSGTNVRFKDEDFRRWAIEGDDYVLYDKTGNITSRGSLRDCKSAISFDLAWEEGKDSDFCVMMPGLLTPQSDILIYKYVAKKGLRPNQMKELFFQMVERLEKMTGSSTVFGSEKAMLEKVVKWILKQEMRERNKFVASKELVWEGDKITRAEIRLEPRYAQNTIYHMDGMGELEHQLLRFPFGTHDDLVDAEQGLVQLLQYPKQLKQAEKSDAFMKVRQFAIDSRKRRSFFGFGKKQRIFGIHARNSVL